MIVETKVIQGVLHGRESGSKKWREPSKHEMTEHIERMGRELAYTKDDRL